MGIGLSRSAQVRVPQRECAQIAARIEAGLRGEPWPKPTAAPDDDNDGASWDQTAASTSGGAGPRLRDTWLGALGAHRKPLECP